MTIEEAARHLQGEVKEGRIVTEITKATDLRAMIAAAEVEAEAEAEVRKEIDHHFMEVPLAEK